MGECDDERGSGVFHYSHLVKKRPILDGVLLRMGLRGDSMEGTEHDNTTLALRDALGKH